MEDKLKKVLRKESFDKIRNEVDFKKIDIEKVKKALPNLEENNFSDVVSDAKEEIKTHFIDSLIKKIQRYSSTD